VEPYHIIALGLAIAAAGVIWLMLKAEDPRIAQLQGQVLVLQQHIAKTAPASTAQVPPTPPPPKRYTTYEKEQRLRAVDEIYNVIATQLQPTYNEGRKLVFEIYQAPTIDDRAEQHLTDYADKAQASFDNLNTFLKKYNYFADIVQVTTINKFNAVAATHGVKNLVPEIQALRIKAPNDIHWFLLRNTTMMDALNQIRDFEQYLNDTLPRLQEKRAEIEKAEVYSGQ